MLPINNIDDLLAHCREKFPSLKWLVNDTDEKRLNVYAIVPKTGMSVRVSYWLNNRQSQAYVYFTQDRIHTSGSNDLNTTLYSVEQFLVIFANNILNVVNFGEF